MTPFACVTGEVWTLPLLYPSAFVFTTDSGHIVAFSILGALAGTYLFFRGFHILKLRRLILNTPQSKIRSAAMGLVEVSGLACGPYIMNAPLTGLPCYYYRTVAWQYKKTGKENEWVEVASENRYVPFYLDDNTGQALVNPQGAMMDIHCDLHEEYSDSWFTTLDRVPESVRDFLARHDVPTDHKTKVEEYCIKPKNALFILGTLAENPGLQVSDVPLAASSTHSQPVNGWHMSVSARLDIGLPEPAGQPATVSAHSSGPEVIRLSSTADAAMRTSQQATVAAALVRAGITSPAAWQAAGLNPAGATSPASNSAAAPAPAADFDLNPKTVLMKGAHNPTFMISWRSQREVVSSMGWECSLMIWGGPILVLFCAYLLAAHFALL
jgi:hypothetical protein